MSSSKSAFSAALALHRVFIAPLIHSGNRHFQHTFLRAQPNQFSKLLLTHQRCYASPPAMKRLPRDDEIKSRTVRVVGEDGKLKEPQQTLEVLNSLNRTLESLVIVDPGTDGSIPICKIINKKAEREAVKAKKAVKNPGAVVKTIELNWAIDANDLGHRLKKMKEFLGKGNKVELILASKRKGRKASPEEADMVLQKIREAIAEVDGAKESKAMEGKVLGHATLFIQGKA
ncbi:hypothetical protein F5884DRAFT_295015 [Xylogone sp. PMI_703]|nr:hypothetical protein F5884DRAFT_295015 [Xylogone sp. PMI_703]